MATDRESWRKRDEAARKGYTALCAAKERVGIAEKVKEAQVEVYKAKKEDACVAWVAEAEAIDVAGLAWAALKVATEIIHDARSELAAARKAVVEAEEAFRAASRRPEHL